MPQLHDPAPAFSLFHTPRSRVSLSDFAGRKLVVAFYPAAFTGVCTKEVCALTDAIARFNDLNAAVVGISVDAPFANAAFAEKNGVGFPLLSDYNREAVHAWGVELHDFAGMPGYTASQRAVFVVDEGGRIIYRWVAEHPGLEPDYAAVEAALK